MATSFYVLIYFGTILGLGSVCALTEDDYKAFYAAVVPLAKECSKELGVDMKDLMKEVDNGEMRNCFIACFFKHLGILKNGMFDPEECVNKISTIAPKTDKLQKYLVPVRECAVSANEYEVTDGDEGCDRAGFYVDCLHDRLGGLDD